MKKKYKAATPSKRMLRGESAMFDIQPVLSAIPAPISTLVTLYFALNPPLCRLWEPAGALYKSRSSRSCLTLSNRPFLDSRLSNPTSKTCKTINSFHPHDHTKYSESSRTNECQTTNFTCTRTCLKTFEIINVQFVCLKVEADISQCNAMKSRKLRAWAFL